MSPFLPTSKRVEQARALIQKAREVPIQNDLGLRDLAYIAQVKDTLRQARDLIKFIHYSPSASPEIKEEVKSILIEIEQAEKVILHK
jgi:Flp pilus assembly protein TadD